MYKKILVPIDYSNKDLWKRALPVAIEEAKLHGAQITAVTVVPELIALPNLPAGYGSGTKKHVREVVEELVKSTGADIPVSVREGSIYREILKEAKDAGADCIIIATDRHHLSDFLLGTNAMQVVRHADCSVQVVRVPD
ncbi:MAG: universal stress protein [Pseudomonadota bacterium]